MQTRRGFLKTTAAVAASPYLFQTQLQSAHGQQRSSTFEMFADFESGAYDGWTLEGACWDAAPASNQTFAGKITGFHGDHFLCTLHPRLGVAATGRAISREFRIERPFIDFLIGGGRYPDEACLNLVVDGTIVCTATGDDSAELRPAFWDVAAWIGKTAHFEVVDRTRARRGYVMVDAIRLADQPPFRELVPGQNAFFCFSKEDHAGRAFQSLFATPEGRSNRALTDFCVDKVIERLALSVNAIDRSDINQPIKLLRSYVDRVFSQYQVRDSLTKQLIAANACSALTALLTTYDDPLGALIEEKPTADLVIDHAINMREPATVLRRGKAVCGGIAALEQSFALSFRDLGLECLVANGHTRHPDDTPYTLINHSWTLYTLGDRSLWAPADTTKTISTLRSARTLPRAKFARSSLLAVDPLLRDMYTLFHYMRECRVGHPGAYVNDRVVNLTTQREWAHFQVTHPYVLKSGHNTLAQIDREDMSRLA